MNRPAAPTVLAEIDIALAEVRALKDAFTRLERPLEALRERAVQGQSVALPPCTVPITEHRRQHRSGRPPVIDSNPVLQAFIVARLDRLTFKEIADDIARHFPADQHLHQSTIHRWSQKRR